MRVRYFKAVLEITDGAHCYSIFIDICALFIISRQKIKLLYDEIASFIHKSDMKVRVCHITWMRSNSTNFQSCVFSV